jgi:uncharacterized membrane protein
MVSYMEEDMQNFGKLMGNVMTGVMVIGLTLGPSNAFAAKAGFEKCAGIVKAGKNDCGNSRHSCAGQASKDGMNDEWLYVPEGTCKKIMGGEIFKKKK